MSICSNTFFVVSQYHNDVSWIKDYTDQYVIYDKSFELDENDPHVIRVPNCGHNIFDIFDFIVKHYTNLPDTIAFLEGNPFDHCPNPTFDKLIVNHQFTPIEDYAHIPESYAHKKDGDGGYMEINTSWYLSLPEPYQHKYYTSFDEFFNVIFKDYEHLDWIRFAPGGQYIVPKENILKYDVTLYEVFRHMVDYAQYTMESHLLERSLWYIFSNKYEEKIYDSI